MKKITYILFLFAFITNVSFAQTTENFEDETAHATSFTSNSQTFNVTSSNETYNIFVTGTSDSGTTNTCLGCGWGGSSADNKFLDNNGTSDGANNGTNFTIKTNGGTIINVKSLYLYTATNNAVSQSHSGTLTITGKLGGVTIYTITKSSGFNTNVGVANGFTLIDFATEGGNQSSNIDELVFSGSGNLDYMALDAFRWDFGATNTAPVIGNTVAGQTVNDNATITPFSSITTTDADGDNLTATITLDNNAKGLITGADSFNGTSYVMNSRSPGLMQAALQALSFNPTDNRSASAEETTFTVEINDGTDTDSDDTTTVISSAVAPTVNSVSVPSNATYTAGQNLDFTVNFNENINVTGTPLLNLTIGSVTKQAAFIGGSGSASLLFRYTVQNGDNDNNGIALGSLALNAGTLRDSGGANANLTLNSVGNTTSVLVDAVDPTVTSVTVPANATYIAGQNLDFTVNFNENITVSTTSGTPQIAITIGATVRQASYISGSGGSALLFRYTVQNGDNDTDGIAVGTLASNGGTLRDAAGNNANLTLNSVGSTTSVLVDASAPTVSSVSVPSNATYIAGQNLDFTVNFNENITVSTTSGTPQIAITIGATVRQASYISGSGGSALLFRYTVQNGDNDTDGIAVGTLASNGGTLRDAAGNNANLTLNSVGSTTSVLVDANVPSLSSSSPADGAVSIGKSSNITLTFNENIAFGTGNIQVIDVTDGSNSFAINVASATTQVAINGAVLTINPSSDLDYNSNYAIQIATTAITDASGNNFAGITDNTTLDFTTEVAPGTGKYLNFDGNDDVVDMGSSMSPVLDAINTFTVEAKVRTTTTTGLGVIAGIYDYPSTATGMQFLLRRDGANYIFWIDHGTGFRNVVATGAVTPNVWQHVAGTWDGTNMRIYVDGVLINTASEAASSFRTLTGVNLAIGTNAHGESFTGDIDEVRIWSKVRTVGEILTNKDGEISNTETGLLAYYQFNQGTGEANNASVTNLTDNSVNNYTGTLSNFALSGISSNWLSPALIWTGATDNNWDTATNWNKSVLPSSAADVTIPGSLSNYPTATNAVTINSLNVASGASIIANNTFTTTTSATYSRNLTGSRWYMMGAPVVGETYDNTWAAANSIATGSTSSSNYGVSTYDFQQNDATTGSWTYLQTNNTNNGTFINGKGYGIIRSGNGDVSFTGTGINNTQVNISTSVLNGTYHLIANPFLGYVSIDDIFLDNDELQELDTDLFFWDGSSYITRSSGADSSFEIAPGQGFFIRSVDAFDFEFNYARVSHNNSDTFGKSSNQRPEIHLFVSEGSKKASARVLYIDGTTKGYDAGYDGKLFGGVAHSFAIYSDLIESDGKKYQSQSLPNQDYESMVIPIGVIAAAGKEITFTTEVLNIPSGLNVYLEDRQNNTFTKLNEANANYKVTLSEKLDGIGRFYLHTASKALSNPSEILTSVRIYKTNNTNLRIAGLQNGEATVKLFTLLGKQVLAKSFIANGTKNIALPNLASGIYIVKLENKAGSLSKKIILE